LKAPVRLIVTREQGAIVLRLAVPDLRGELRGRGPTSRAAIEDLGRRFDRLVRQNRNIPPHTLTPENERIGLILDRRVDWDRYERESPLVQPMWGQVRARRDDGSVLVHWVIGPWETEGQEAELAGSHVPPSLAEMEVGTWFYGAAKCYPLDVEWVEQPHVVPDPRDQEARRRLWEGLPRVPADQPDCWPSKSV